MKVLIARAFLVCSTDYFLQMELEHLEKVFVKVNGYPKWLIYNTIKTKRNKKFTSEQIDVEIEDAPDVAEEDKVKKILQIVLPYQGQKGESIMRRLTNTINKTLPQTTTRVTYKGTRLSTKFNIKDREKIENVHDVVYEAKCPDCPQNYIGETSRHLVERVDEHSQRSKF